MPGRWRSIRTSPCCACSIRCTALAPLAQVVQFPIVVCAHTKLGVTDIKQLIALGKTRQLVVGSSGNGSVQHLAGEALKRTFGLQTLHLPFAGGGPVQEALTKGALDVLCETGSNVVRHIREGRLVALAVMSKQRLATLPDVPTFAELGHAGSRRLGLVRLAGAGGDAATAIQDKMSAAVLAVLEDANVKQGAARHRRPAVAARPQAFREFIAAEHARWGKFIHDAGLKPTGTDAGASIGTPR